MEKKKYGFVGNMRFHFGNMLRWYPGMFAAGFGLIVPEVAGALGNVVLARVFAAGLEEKWELSLYLGRLVAVSALLLLCTLVQSGLFRYQDGKKRLYIYRYEFLVAQKKMTTDYEILESKGFQDLAKKVKGELWYGGGFYEKTGEIDKFLCGISGCVIFGTLLAAQNPWILLFLLISVIINYANHCLCKRAEYRRKDLKAAAWREMEYVQEKSGDISAGKDIRIYRMADWFLSIYQEAFGRHKKADREIWNWYGASNAVNATLVFGRDILVYAYLILQICRGKLSAADFVYFTGLVASLSDWLWKTADGLHELGGASFCISCIREFLDQPDRAEGGRAGLGTDIAGKPVTVEFRHVSYRYPGAQADTLRDLNLTLRAGEKLAMVGLNGAGKTTFVKLLCRLYHPTEGEILINGIPSGDFTREEYFSLLSVLFQNSAFLPVSVDENTASLPEDKLDQKRLCRAYDVSGIKEKLEGLDRKGKTHMLREVWDDAVDFSGGERQRLLLARAVYQNSSLLILDEPTAALDPIAEHEVYLHYSSLAEGRTCIFISHRLASTRFCDRIVLLQDGRIAEEGTHEELLALGGSYSHLFAVQREYYRQKGEEQEA